MILYHATKNRSSFEAICAAGELRPGRNVKTRTILGVHLSRDPFCPGSYALDVIGADTNEAWVFEVEVPDDTPLSPDPSGEGSYYNGTWVVYQGNLAITIRRIVYIPDVRAWENGKPSAAVLEVPVPKKPD